MPYKDPEKARESRRRRYAENRERILSGQRAARAAYRKEHPTRRVRKSPEAQRQYDREKARRYYWRDPETAREKNRRRYADDPERRRAYQRAYAERNKDKIRERDARRYRETRERERDKNRARARQWAKENPDKIRERRRSDVYMEKNRVRTRWINARRLTADPRLQQLYVEQMKLEGVRRALVKEMKNYGKQERHVRTSDDR